MFERFTDEAIQVTVDAEKEARRLIHNYIGTEHILLGLELQADTVAAEVLQSLGVTLNETRKHVEMIVGHGEEATSGRLPYTPRAKQLIELSLREALNLGHNYIGTEHLLLGLVREGEGVAARILDDFFKLEMNRVRDEVIKHLAEPPTRAQRRVKEAHRALPLTLQTEFRNEYRTWLAGCEEVFGRLPARHPSAKFHSELRGDGEVTKAAAEKYLAWATLFDERLGPFAPTHPVNSMCFAVVAALSQMD